MKNIFCTDKPSLVKYPIFIDGLGRTGKFLLGKIVSSFKDIENFQYASVIEQILYMQKIGAITKDGAISLIKSQIDENGYNMLLGRNLNLREDDATSIYNNLEYKKYLKRGVTPYSEELKNKIRNSNSRFTFILHASLPHFKLLYEAYPKVKFIHLARHPIDVIHSWHINGWGNRLTQDPLSFGLVLEINNDLIPWYVKDWKNEYVSTNIIDRVIKMVHTLSKYENDTYTSLPKQTMDLILKVKYELLVENTFDTIDLLSKFLNTEPNKKIKLTLERENCPRTISLSERTKKHHEIKENASNYYINLLDELIINYEEEISTL